MNDYFLTVYSPEGKKSCMRSNLRRKTMWLRKKIGSEKLTKQKYENYTHRLTRSGKLLLFER